MNTVRAEPPQRHSHGLPGTGQSKIATADRNGGMFVWEGYTGREYLTLKGHGGAITGLSWRADSNVLASCSEDGSIRLWEMENGRQIKNWGAHSGGVASVEFARDGRLLSGGRDRMAKFWNQDGKQLLAFKPSSDLVLQITFCDEANRAIAGDWNGSIVVWNAEDGSRLGEVSANPPTLLARLEAAERELATRQQTQDKLLEVFRKANTVVQKTRAELVAAQQTVLELQNKSDAVTVTVKTAQDDVATRTTRHEELAKSVAMLGQALPDLKEAAAKAQAAADKLASDKQLSQQVQQLKSLAEQRTAKLAEQQNQVSATATELEKAQLRLAGVKKSVSSAATALEKARKMSESLAPPVKAAEEKAAMAKAAVDQSASDVAGTRQLVRRWTEEIKFDKRIKQLASERQVALNTLAERTEQLRQLNATAEAAEAAARKAAVADTQKKVDRLKEEFLEARGLE